MLLTNTESIFDELDCHQVTLQTMQSSSAAGSFLDEVMKWQKKLQTIEQVLTVWLEVQDQWEELEDVRIHLFSNLIFNKYVDFAFYMSHKPGGARCSSVVRAFAHGAMGHRIDPSWWTH